jgi:hypothetical protein
LHERVSKEGHGKDLPWEEDLFSGRHSEVIVDRRIIGVIGKGF